jgi:hypothetical protein
MALTKISGEVIQTPLNVGVVTATRIDGNVSGDVNSTGVSTFSGGIQGNLTGNVNSTGVSTFSTLKVGASVDISGGIVTARSDVIVGAGLSVVGITTLASAGGITTTGGTLFTKQLNVSGVSTLGNTIVGGATTQLIVNGNARITGILTVGTSSVTINGTTNTISGVSSVTDDTGGYLTIPPGAIQFFARNTAPNGWLKANGATISRSAYAALFADIGTTFGAGNGSTTFVIPDLRGEFPRGWDDGRGADSGRAFGSAQLDQMQKITGSVQFRPTSSGVDNGLFFPVPGGAFSSSVSSSLGMVSQSGSASSRIMSFDNANSPDARVSSTTSGETRSRNIALLACIKY